MPMKGGGGGGGKDVRAGGAFVEIFGRDNLTKMLEKLKARVLQFGAFLNVVGKTALKAGGALALPLTILLGQGANRAAQVDKLAESFGMSAEQMSKLAGAAEIAGVSIEEVIANQSKYQKLIDSSPTISGDQAKAATAATQEFRSSLMAVQNALLPILKTITPIITAVGEFAKKNAGLIQIVAAVAAGLVAFGAVASVAGAAVSGIAGAVGFVVPLLLPLIKIAAVLGLIVAAGYGVYKLLQQFELGQSIIGEFAAGLAIVRDIGGRAFADIGAAIGTAFGGIMDAFKAGDLALAGEIALKGLEVVWARTMLALTEAWVAFKASFGEAWHTMVFGAELLWEQSTNAIAMAIVNIAEFIVTTFLDAVQRLVDGAGQIADALGLEDVASGLNKVSGAVGALSAHQKKLAQETRAQLVKDLKDKEAALAKELKDGEAARAASGAKQTHEERLNYLKKLAELEVLRQKAAELATSPIDSGPRGLLPTSLFIPSQKDLFKQARGGFASSASAGQFGFGDKGDGIIGELKALNKLAANWIGATANLNIIAENSKKFGIVVGN